MVEDTVLDETSLRMDNQKEPEPIDMGKLIAGILVFKSEALKRGAGGIIRPSKYMLDLLKNRSIFEFICST